MEVPHPLNSLVKSASNKFWGQTTFTNAQGAEEPFDAYEAASWAIQNLIKEGVDPKLIAVGLAFDTDVKLSNTFLSSSEINSEDWNALFNDISIAIILAEMDKNEKIQKENLRRIDIN
jgi:hypothetical protein